MKNYQIYTTNGQRLVIQAARFEQDGSGTRLYDDNGNLVAGFYSGQVAQLFPEGSVQEADTDV